MKNPYVIRYDLIKGLQHAITRELGHRGITRRAAQRGYQKLFQVMARALARGETVETPVGVLEVVPESRQTQKRIRLGQLVTLFRERRKVVLKEVKEDL